MKFAAPLYLVTIITKIKNNFYYQLFLLNFIFLFGALNADIISKMGMLKYR